MDGWIKLHRKLLDWQWYDDTTIVRVFLHLLLKANFDTKGWHDISIERGQLVTSIKNIAAETHLSAMQIRRALTQLQKTKEITIETTNKYTMITICNYAKYQCFDSGEQQTNNNQITNEQQTNNNQTTTTKEINNIRIKELKNVDNIYSPKNENFDADKSATNKPQPKTIEERKNDFMKLVAENGVEKYGQEMCREFFGYWTESNPNGKKMRFEMQKVFDVKRRLATWNKNNFKNQNYGNKRIDSDIPTERIVAAGRAMAAAGL
jgi:hypothetical protein